MSRGSPPPATGPAVVVEDLHRGIEIRLRRARQRYTTGRRALVEVLRTAPRPLAIADLLDAGVGQSQSSLYRNLQVLEQAGAVERIVTADEAGARFELAEDLTDDHHHHLICRSCGTVQDFSLPHGVEAAIERATAEAGARAGFDTERHRFDLVGTCAECD